jgi:hypothetical protein
MKSFTCTIDTAGCRSLSKKEDLKGLPHTSDAHVAISHSGIDEREAGAGSSQFYFSFELHFAA